MLAHNIRWQVVRLLASSDRRVHELVSELQQPANLVSYHLRLLRESGLVLVRKSDADARDLYYRLNLPILQTMFQQAGADLHPALVTGYHAGLKAGAAHSPISVLFLCTHNSARSQMAEAFLRTDAHGALEVFSAGSQPEPVNPLAIQAMAEFGIDISTQQPKHIKSLSYLSFDYVITVCDQVREVCPAFPGLPEYAHWSITDPAEFRGSTSDRVAVFRETAREIRERIGHLIALLAGSASADTAHTEGAPSR